MHAHTFHASCFCVFKVCLTATELCDTSVQVLPRQPAAQLLPCPLTSTSTVPHLSTTSLKRRSMSSCCRSGQGRQVAGSTERGALCMPAPETDSRAEEWPVTFYSDCSRACHLPPSPRTHAGVPPCSTNVTEQLLDVLPPRTLPMSPCMAMALPPASCICCAASSAAARLAGKCPAHTACVRGLLAWRPLLRRHSELACLRAALCPSSAPMHPAA